MLAMEKLSEHSSDKRMLQVGPKHWNGSKYYNPLIARASWSLSQTEGRVEGGDEGVGVVVNTVKCCSLLPPHAVLEEVQGGRRQRSSVREEGVLVEHEFI